MRVTGLHQYMVAKNMRRRGVESYVSTLKWLCENAGVEPTPTSQPKYDFKIKEGEYGQLREWEQSHQPQKDQKEPASSSRKRQGEEQRAIRINICSNGILKAKPTTKNFSQQKEASTL